MKNFKLFLMLLFVVVSFASCDKVPAGYVGVKVDLLGSNKGVQQEVLGVGRYWIGFNEELYTYPIYQVNYVFTADDSEGSPENEEFKFQTNEGMSCSMDLGVSLHFDSDKISQMFQTYRKGPEEIRAIVVRNALRDALNKVAGKMPVESVYGSGKGFLVDTVQIIAKKQLDSTGIIIDKISLINDIRIPPSIKKALNSKVEMTQKAQQIENEVRAAKAQAEIILVRARAEAESNALLSKSLSPSLLKKMELEKWNGSYATTITTGMLLNK